MIVLTLALALPAGDAPPPNGYVPPKVEAPAPKSPPELPGAAFSDCRECPEMIVIPPGEFIMGSTQEERDALGVLPMFDRVGEGGCEGDVPDEAGGGRGRRPVINVNFSDAQNYVAWLRERTGEPYRLLSEAEWEYAGRAGTDSWYPFGNAIDPTRANYGNNHDRTAEVGSYPPNRFGLYDMTANVAQWVADCHHDDYVGAPQDGSAWLSGPCELRNVRGGGWSLQGWSVRVAQRIGDPPGARNDHLGFRVARDLPQD